MYLAEDYSKRHRKEKGYYGQTKSSLPSIYLEDSTEWMTVQADIKLQSKTDQ